MFHIQNLSKSFKEHQIFDQLNLELQDGTSYALIGRSGSGKSTLLNILARLENYDSGSIKYQGNALESKKLHQFYRDDLGYLFQNFGLLETDTVRTNLDLGLLNYKLSRKEKDQKQLEALHSVGLNHITLDTKIYTLSGGEAQRVALAKVILKDPPLILADEPTAALDPNTSDQIMDLILERKRKGRCIVVATHNPEVWNKMDHVLTIENKNVVFSR